jgi:hypothetical protein
VVSKLSLRTRLDDDDDDDDDDDNNNNTKKLSLVLRRCELREREREGGVPKPIAHLDPLSGRLAYLSFTALANNGFNLNYMTPAVL